MCIQKKIKQIRKIKLINENYDLTKFYLDLILNCILYYDRLNKFIKPILN